MSGELMVSTAAAVISALGSVAGAIIQSRSKGPGERPEPARPPQPSRPSQPQGRLRSLTTRIDFGDAKTGGRGADGVWIAVALVLAIETVVLATRDAEFSAALNSVVLIPLVTLVLVLARPIGWGYACGTVTLLHVTVLAAAVVLGRGRLESTPQVFFLVFVANALIVGGIAFLRTRAQPKALGGALVTGGVLAVAWLLVPVFVRVRRPEPEPVPVEARPLEPRPVRLHPVRPHAEARRPEERVEIPARSFDRRIRFVPMFKRVEKRERPED